MRESALWDTVQFMTCPYCAGTFTPRLLDGQPGFGILTCACGDSPVVDGVLWLARRRDDVPGREFPARASTIDFLNRGDPKSAAAELLLRSSQSPWRRLATLIERLDRPVPSQVLGRIRSRIDSAVLSPRDAAFNQVVRELRNGPYADYLYQRFANPSLLASMPVMLLLKELSRGSRVLELGGGTGHANFLMQRWFPDLQFILTDADVTNLFMARRFIAPRATHICLDAETRLPFPDHSIDAVYCQDAFHYMRAKASVVQELHRVVKPGGLWLFPHLHNALVANPAAGMPLPPAEYARLFSGVEGRLFPEAAILKDFHEHLRIDLSKPPDQAQLNSAQSLTMIAGPSSLWKLHDLSSLVLQPASDLAINRIYSGAAAGTAGPIHWPNDGLRHECAHIEPYLPADPKLDPALLTRLKQGQTTSADHPELERLIRHFVLVPLPERYG